ncbi:MAG TPA: UDP-N-acetylglucosamine pyrophosphorylase [Nannocystaceae bacterium]|nr:UDP-N-acetylglucosamine pyrophosphorylase [Nannocystaceae bacterium]
MERGLSERVAELSSRGVVIVDARQVYLGDDVVLERIAPGATLHPGTRLHGARTWVGAGAQIGVEGPATVIDAVFDRDTAIDSGFVQGAVLLRGAKLGANAHVRAGTLLEEGASTAHAVGLKQTILLAWVTLGSLINFCDVLMAGGTSRRDHSEVGSGFIHFNFTPWGKAGDKATASLVGDVVDGVLLRQPRIFLGGAGGMVGPRKVGYGGIAAAGQVLRRDLAAAKMVLAPPPSLTSSVRVGQLDASEPRGRRNLDYIAQLVALRAWYRQVRMARAHDDAAREVVGAACAVIDGAFDERVLRLRSFLEERGAAMPQLQLDPPIPCPLALQPDDVEHTKWVQALDEESVERLRAWLKAVTEASLTSP